MLEPEERLKMQTGPRHRWAAVPIRYVLVSWLFVLSAVAYLDRTNVSIAGIQIGREFGIDNAHLGWVISAFLIGYAAFQVPSGLLVHRFGSRRVLTFAVLWWGLFTVLTALVPTRLSASLVLLVAVRFLLGAGEATMYPATSQFVERWFPMGERGKANGIIFGGVGVGSGVTPPLVTAIILHYGWRASFWFSAMAGIVAGIVWFLAARDTPERHPLVGAPELSIIRATRDAVPALRPEMAGAETFKRVVPWAKLFTSKTMIAVTLAYFSFGYIAWVFFGWFYIYLAQARGLNLKVSALYSTLPFIGMTIGSVTGGILSDWASRAIGIRLGRCILPAVSMALTAILLIAGSRADKAGVAGLILACGAGALYFAQSSFWAVTADFAGEYTGVASGIMNMSAQIGGACTASLTPWIAQHFGWEISFLVAAALSILGGIAWLTVNPRQTLTPPDTSTA